MLCRCIESAVRTCMRKRRTWKFGLKKVGASERGFFFSSFVVERVNGMSAGDEG